jgi:hypothetical protein
VRVAQQASRSLRTAVAADVYCRTNLTEAWKHVRENKGSAGIDGLTIGAFAEREDELRMLQVAAAALSIHCNILPHPATELSHGDVTTQSTVARMRRKAVVNP